MPQYKLIYFNTAGRAELIRLLFAYADQEYEDFRFEHSQWPQFKLQMPFKQVPVLEIDGKQVCQSHTIARYLARQFKLNGKSDFEAALADQYVDIIYDLTNGAMDPYHEKDPEKRKQLFDKYVFETANPQLVLVEKHLAKNASGHLVGEELTWADIACYNFLSVLATMTEEDIYSDIPMMKALVDRVGNIPNIKKYVESRPKV